MIPKIIPFVLYYFITKYERACILGKINMIFVKIFCYGWKKLFYIRHIIELNKIAR